jgi:hypothetical protein
VKKSPREGTAEKTEREMMHKTKAKGEKNYSTANQRQPPKKTRWYKRSTSGDEKSSNVQGPPFDSRRRCNDGLMEINGW